MANKVNTKNWSSLPIAEWNTSTVHAFLIDETRRKYNAEYTPGGRGSLSQRWNTEQGMIKRELTKRGPEVVRKFIEICWREYFTPNPKKYPYPNLAFMAGYMDRYWTAAEEEVHKAELVEKAAVVDISNVDEKWF